MVDQAVGKRGRMIRLRREEEAALLRLAERWGIGLRGALHAAILDADAANPTSTPQNTAPLEQRITRLERALRHVVQTQRDHGLLLQAQPQPPQRQIPQAEPHDEPPLHPDQD